MNTILGFKSCAQNGEFTQLGVRTPSNIYYIGVNSPDAIDDYIIDCYKDDANLAGKVNGIGYGWQKYVIPITGRFKFSVRGAAGGSTGRAGYTIDPISGNVVGTGNKPGRGAKLEGTCVLTAGSILYILVGMRGWCNNGGDWGSGGGGASVVLLDNENGAYTFTPLNRKVDVLFVAGGGGGCYDSSFGAAYYGADADYKDSINTNGGSGNDTGGGAGLTGNGGTSHNGTAYSILSGKPTTTVLNTNKHGGWGGGGNPYDGGGSGGGYSGGNSKGDGHGGNGGTSYINPLLCTETFRGYATVDKDSARNLENPWTAYGYVEIEFSDRADKLILAKDSDGYKWFNGDTNPDGTINASATNTWELLSDQSVPTQDTYDTYGKALITNVTGLQDKVRFLISDIDENDELNIIGKVNKSVVEQIKDNNTSDIDIINSLTFTGATNNTIIKFAVSKDYGDSWQTYNNGGWKDIDITDRDRFLSDGYLLDQIVSIPLTDWTSYMSKSLRFAFIIDQTDDKTGQLIDNIQINADLLGSWAHAKESQAEYEYVSDNALRVTFLEAGDYKVNYFDKIIKN